MRSNFAFQQLHLISNFEIWVALFGKHCNFGSLIDLGFNFKVFAVLLLHFKVDEWIRGVIITQKKAPHLGVLISNRDFWVANCDAKPVISSLAPDTLLLEWGVWLTACSMFLLWRLESISRAVNACSATSIHWITWSCEEKTNIYQKPFSLLRRGVVFGSRPQINRSIWRIHAI